MIRDARPRRTRRAARLPRRLLALAVTGALLAPATPVMADPTNPDDAAIAGANAAVDASDSDVARIVSTLTSTQDEIARLELEMGGLREKVNKALVDLHDAQANAEDARQKAKKAREDLDATQVKMEAAQARLDELSRAAYKQGASVPGVTAVAGRDQATDALDRKTYIRTTAAQQEKAIQELDRLRAEKANNESELRQAKNLADERAEQARVAEEQARAEIEDSSARLKERNAERDRLVIERDVAQARLESARSNAGGLLKQREEYEAFTKAMEEKARADKAAQDAAAARAAAEQRAADAAEKAEQAQQQPAPAPAPTPAPEAAPAAANAEQAPAPEAAAPAAPSPTEQAQPAPAPQNEAPAPAAAPAPTAEETAAAQRAAAEEEARRAAEAAAKAEAEAAQRAADEKAAEDARKAAAAAASLAAAALVAVAAPDHTSLANPYPTDPDADDVPVAATGGTLNLTEDTTPAPAQQAAPTTTTQAADPQTAVNDGQFGAGDLLNLLDQLTGSNKPGTVADVSKTTTQAVTGSREEKIEAVISRAMGVIGTPYAWGGGDANGPTKGIRDGGVADSYGDYNKVGFDCSGLVLYAFAGVGIALPHYTGYQYQKGTKVAPSEMQRGDLIFYGPNAENHVAIYLGDGTMIEAPQSGSTVHISPVRWGGMSPYVVRLI